MLETLPPLVSPDPVPGEGAVGDTGELVIFLNPSAVGAALDGIVRAEVGAFVILADTEGIIDAIVGSMVGSKADPPPPIMSCAGLAVGAMPAIDEVGLGVTLEARVGDTVAVLVEHMMVVEALPRLSSP